MSEACAQRKRKSYASLKRTLDVIFSRYIRLRAANKNGYSACVSCGSVKRWQDQQAGHFVSRVRLSTRWDEQNCATQCPRCNILLRGNPVGYARYLQDRYGSKIFVELEERSRRPVKFARFALEAMCDEYAEKLKALSAKLTRSV